MADFQGNFWIFREISGYILTQNFLQLTLHLQHMVVSALVVGPPTRAVSIPTALMVGRWSSAHWWLVRTRREHTNYTQRAAWAEHAP